jgi:DNA processing protein
MAVISDATVIVEAGETSGTLHQGWEALRLGRPLFIMESVFEAGHAWAEEMTLYGAERLSDETLPILFERLPEGSRIERSRVTF